MNGYWIKKLGYILYPILYLAETNWPFWQKTFRQPRSIYKIAYVSDFVVGKFSLLECIAALSSWKVKPIKLSIAWLVRCQTVSVVLRLHKRICHSWVTTHILEGIEANRPADNTVIEFVKTNDSRYGSVDLVYQREYICSQKLHLYSD